MLKLEAYLAMSKAVVVLAFCDLINIGEASQQRYQAHPVELVAERRRTSNRQPPTLRYDGMSEHLHLKFRVRYSKEDHDTYRSGRANFSISSQCMPSA
jgi:hypothetical protein